MSTKWYGSFQNRLMENKHADEITVGMGMTEFGYSDREAYEVIDVKDQKHVTVRRLDHKHVGEGSMDNNWELISNEENPTYEMVKRGKYWYYTATWTAEEVDRLIDERDKVWLIINGWDLDKIREKGSQTKYRRANVSFGFADYYYDYSF